MAITTNAVETNIHIVTSSKGWRQGILLRFM